MIPNDGSQLVPSGNFQPPGRHHPVLPAVMAEIGTHRSSPEIDVAANDGITRIAQMGNKRPVSDDAVLQFHPLPRYTAVSHGHISSQMAVGPKTAAVPHPCGALNHHAGHHHGALSHTETAQDVNARPPGKIVSLHSLHHSLLPVQQVPGIDEALHSRLPPGKNT